ncbi:unnamed protein product [Lactuca virosa]|uniref:Uncharacterized protein n=1 Tax=Lactuca virosa TaxID=75947 RepID=A0AAU9N287_9ASTR|nr:unnamed protein product [Lactuca virosa]
MCTSSVIHILFFLASSLHVSASLSESCSPPPQISIGVIAFSFKVLCLSQKPTLFIGSTIRRPIMSRFDSTIIHPLCLILQFGTTLKKKSPWQSGPSSSTDVDKKKEGQRYSTFITWQLSGILKSEGAFVTCCQSSKTQYHIEEYFVWSIYGQRWSRCMSYYRNGDYKYYNRIQFPQLGNILWNSCIINTIRARIHRVNPGLRNRWGIETSIWSFTDLSLIFYYYIKLVEGHTTIIYANVQCICWKKRIIPILPPLINDENFKIQEAY